MNEKTLLWWIVSSMAVMAVFLAISFIFWGLETIPNALRRRNNEKGIILFIKKIAIHIKKKHRMGIMKRRARAQIARALAEEYSKEKKLKGLSYFAYRCYIPFLLFFINGNGNQSNSKKTLIGECKEKKKEKYKEIRNELRELRLANARRKRKHFFNPYQIFLGGFFIATALLFVPVNYFNDFASEANIIREIKTILISLVDAIKVFVVDSDYRGLVEAFDKLNIKPPYSTVYSVYAAVIHFAGPVVAAGFILSFFKEAVSLFRLRFHWPRKYLYIMSELNARSLALAEDIIRGEDSPRGTKLIVFTDVFEKDDDRVHELIDRAKQLGAICVKKDITEINLKFAVKDKYRKLYFLSENEEKNIKQALKMIENATSVERCNVYETEMYVFAITIESEALLDSVNKRNIKVRRINENRNLVYKAMVDYPIFNDTLDAFCDAKKDRLEVEKSEKKQEADALQNDIDFYEDTKNKYLSKGRKSLDIAIIGLGGYGMELLKTICWLGQVEGYNVNIHAFENGSGKEKIQFAAPELYDCNHKAKVGNSDYDIHFYDNEDVTKPEFFDRLLTAGQLTSIYVTLGDDELNIQTAMRIRTHLSRNNRINDLIPIYAVVFSQVKTDMLNGGKWLKTTNGEQYNITFIGSLKDLCNLETIEQSTNEEIAKEGHLYWADFYENVYPSGDKSYKEREKERFEKYEYYRKASMAQAIFYRILKKAKIAPSIKREDLGKYEHARWNVFMRAEGFVKDKEKKFVKKTHYDLVDFEALNDVEQKKDLFFDMEKGRLTLNGKKENED
ncbi:MAG: hypothetical protein J6A95_06760 [Clostridia bacterium]|nr:hypothetical protein [Clostridia bacterium]